MKLGQYIVWFAHYGSVDWEPHPGPLEEIVDWVAGMDEEDTNQYDQHGIPLAVERIGTGLVDGFDEMVDARQEARKREREAHAARYAAEREHRRAEQGDQPRFRVRLKPPESVGTGLARCGVVLATWLTQEQAIAETDQLAATFGKDRINMEKIA